MVDRLRRGLPGLWLGWGLCVGLLATPAGFALLPPAEAGRLAGRMLAQDAYTSLALGLLLIMLERRAGRDAFEAGQGSQFTAGLALAAAAVFCTVLGYFGVQPLMPGARAGQGPLSFGQLHAVSVAFFVVKIACVAALAWRALAEPVSSTGPSS